LVVAERLQNQPTTDKLVTNCQPHSVTASKHLPNNDSRMVELNREHLLAQAQVDWLQLRLQEQQFTQQVSASFIIHICQQ